MPVPLDSLSVVIPHYGDPSVAGRLIETLRAQQGAPEFEIIVSDDASSQPFPSTTGVRVVRRQENGGFGSAVNSGIAAATRDHVLVLNSDLVITDTFLRDLVREAAPLMPSVVSPQVVDHDGVPQAAARHFPKTKHHFVSALTPLARFRGTTWWHEGVGHDTRAQTGTITEVDWIVGAVMLMPRAAVTAIHGFDEGFYMNGEEVDLQRRLRNAGIPSHFVGTVTVEHEGGGSSDPERSRAWVVQSSLRYAKKWGPSPLLQRGAMTAAFLINFVVNAGRQLAGRDVKATQILRRELSYVRMRP